MSSNTKTTRIRYRRLQVIQKHLSGMSNVEISKHFDCDVSQVSRDISWQKTMWLKSSIRDFDEARQVKLNEFGHLRETHWSAWYAFMEPKYLTGVFNCLVQETKLLGLFPSDKLEVDWKNSLPAGTSKNDAISQFKKMLSEAKGKLDRPGTEGDQVGEMIIDSNVADDDAGDVEQEVEEVIIEDGTSWR